MTTQHPGTPPPPTKLLLVGQQELNTQQFSDPSQLTMLTLRGRDVRDLSPLVGPVPTHHADTLLL